MSSYSRSTLTGTPVRRDRRPIVITDALVMPAIICPSPSAAKVPPLGANVGAIWTDPILSGLASSGDCLRRLA
jgi:hypothetical protein